MIKPKNVAAGYAHRHIFGLYMDHLFPAKPIFTAYGGENGFCCCKYATIEIP
jgi:hypothetical protein